MIPLRLTMIPNVTRHVVSITNMTRWRGIEVGIRFTATRCVACILVAMLRSACFGSDLSPDITGQIKEAGSLSNMPSIQVQQFVFLGNTAFTDQQLAQLLVPFTQRRITNTQLEEARQILSQHYINHGYINSGAVLPDQSVINGIIRFQIVEGTLSNIIVRGNEHLSDQYIQKRVERGTHAPLNLVHLRNQLEIIRQDSNITRVNAQLKPGALPGESYLDLLVEESNALHVDIGFSNDQSASLGAEQFDLLVSHTNLTGHGDTLQLVYGMTDGGWDNMDFAGDNDISVFYTMPISANHATVTVGFKSSDTVIVEEPFDTLDITSESESVSIAMRIPIYRTSDSQFSVSLSGERTTSRTFLANNPFTLSPGAQNGVSKVTALRFGQQWSTRSQHRAVAVQSTWSLGIDALDATENPARNPDGTRASDGKFFAWLGQFQYIQRLGDGPSQLVVRASAQLTDDPLMSSEQFSIGGLATVRGYRENQMVTDKGFVASIESRIPILFDTSGKGVFYIVPFLDIGLGKNVNGTFNSRETTSLGLGAILHLDNRLNAEIYWGHPFRDFNNSNNDLQDKGILFKVVLTLF